jgi:hypothetical protein
MVGAQSLVIRLNHAADWQSFVLRNVPGSSAAETSTGQSYVELQPIPVLGPGAVLMRSPNETTIITFFGLPPDLDSDAKEKAIGRFLDDSRGEYPWANAWSEVDGGLGTFAFDNREVGWQDIPQDKSEWPAAARPLFDKTEFFAIALDWNGKSDRLAVRVRGACESFAVATEVQQAAIVTLAFAKQESQAALEKAPGEGPIEEDDVKLLESLASAQVRLGPEDADEPFVEATAEIFVALPAAEEMADESDD